MAPTRVLRATHQALLQLHSHGRWRIAHAHRTQLAVQAKPGRARLQLDSDYKWNGNSGAGRLTYRWGRVHRYLQDIAEAKQKL